MPACSLSGVRGIHSCWEDQFNLGPDPDNAPKFHDETIPRVSGKVAQEGVDEQTALS